MKRDVAALGGGERTSAGERHDDYNGVQEQCLL